MLRRLRFLPTFFVALAVVFAIAVAFRIRSLSSSPETSAAGNASSTKPAVEDRGATAAEPQESPSLSDTVAPSSDPAVAARAEKEREKRYRELLNSPPPPRDTTAAARPSFLSRVVAPIVSAFGPRASHPAPPPQQAAVHERTPRDGGTATRPGSSDDAPKKPATDPTDPNSDTTPPQLLAADFTPATIHDGEETLFAVMVSDDLSGVRSVSGNVASPSGALQGFACEREGESNRWVARISVPKNSAEGQWHINFLSLTDAANNSANLAWRQGLLPATAVFRVISSKPDTTPPTLKAASLERPTMRAGEKNSVMIEAEDDQSGVNVISGVFVSPSKFARVSFSCRTQGGTVWQCEVAAPANADCGEWQLEQVQLQDNANNLAVARADNPIVGSIRITITSDGCDSRPPVVQSVMLDSPVINAPGTASLIVVASDDTSGVANVNGYMVFTGTVAGGGQPPRLYFSCRPSGESQWIGTISIPPKAARGIWKLGSLQVMDKAGNLKVYTSADPVAANVLLRVQ